MIWVGIFTVCSTHGAPQEVTVNVLYIITLHCMGKKCSPELCYDLISLMNPDTTIVETGAQTDEERAKIQVNLRIPLQMLMHISHKITVKIQFLFRRHLQRMKRRWMKVEKRTGQTARLPKMTKRSQNLRTSSVFVSEHPRLSLIHSGYGKRLLVFLKRNILSLNSTYFKHFAG